MWPCIVVKVRLPVCVDLHCGEGEVACMCGPALW